MGKQSRGAPDGLSDLFQSLFASENPFRRKPETKTPPPPPQHQQLGLGPSSSSLDDGGGSGTPVDPRSRSGEDAAGEINAKKRKKPGSYVESEGSVPDAVKKKRKSGEREEVMDGPSKRRKKRKRDELEREYEGRRLGFVEDDKTASKGGGEEGSVGVGVAVGQKRKEIDDGKEMVVEESFDDESKLLRTVFAGNLPLKTKRKALLKEFGKFGEVESIRIRSVPITESKIPRKGAIIKGKLNDAVDSVHAYIVFKDEQSAQAALALNMEMIGGNHIRVDMACPPRKKLKGETPLYDIKRTVFVGNLPYDVKDEELYQVFCEDSTVEAIRVIRDPNLSLGKGIAYVLFKTREAAISVVRRKGLNVRGRELRLSRARSDSTPSRTTPSKRSSSEGKRSDFPNKRVEIASEKVSSGKSNKPGKAGSLSYQGLRASKTGVQKKVGRAGERKLKTRTSGVADQKVHKKKRPAVAARKAKALKEVGMKRKLEGGTPDYSHQNKKARHLK